MCRLHGTEPSRTRALPVGADVLDGRLVDAAASEKPSQGADRPLCFFWPSALAWLRPHSPVWPTP